LQPVAWSSARQRNSVLTILLALASEIRAIHLWTRPILRPGTRHCYYLHHVKLDFICLNKPVERGFIESFNGKLRDECLNSEAFLTISDTREKLEHWRHDYNNIFPHSSPAKRPLDEFAREPCGNRKPTV